MKWLDFRFEGDEFKFDRACPSCFLQFVNIGEGKLIAVMSCVKEEDRSDKNFEGTNWESPCESSISLKELMTALRDYIRNQGAASIDQFNKAKVKLYNHLCEHEIHLLFGALRSSGNPGAFTVNPTCDLLMFLQYFRQSSVFGLSIKAVVLKCLVRNQNHFTSVDQFTKALLNFGANLLTFADFFRTTHTNPVLLACYAFINFFFLKSVLGFPSGWKCCRGCYFPWQDGLFLEWAS